MTFTPIVKENFKPIEKKVLDSFSRLEAWKAVSGFEERRIAEGKDATFTECWLDVVDLCKTYEMSGLVGVRERYGVDLSPRSLKVAKEWCEHFEYLVDGSRLPVPEVTENEIVTTKTIKKQGNSLVISISKEAARLGVNIGDSVEIVLRRR